MAPPKCPRCNDALAALANDRNHEINRCGKLEFHVNSPQKFAQMWPLVSAVGDKSDDPGDLQESDYLLKNFNTIDAHKGKTTTKHMLENAWAKVFTKKGVNLAEQQKDSPTSKASTKASSSTTPKASQSGASTSRSSATAGPSKTLPIRAGTSSTNVKSQNLRIVPDAEMRMPAPRPLPSSNQSSNNAATKIFDTRKMIKQTPSSTSRVLERRPNFVPNSSSDLTVLTNHFTVDLNSNKKLYEYTLKGLENETSKKRRRNYVEKLIKNVAILRDQKQHFATDYISTITAWKDLSTYGNQQSIAPDTVLVSANLDVHQRGTIGPVNAITVYVNFNRTINLQDIVDFCSGNNPNYQETGAVAGLNMILSKGRGEAGRDTHEVSQNKLIYKPGYARLGALDDVLAIRSYAYSVRPAMGGLLLNIDVGMSAFYGPMTVFDFAQKRGDWRSLLKGVRVRIMYKRGKDGNDEMDSPERRTRTITGFSEKPASQTMFTKGEGGATVQISVWEHVNQQYPQICKKDSNQFCVDVGDHKSGKHTWFLAEHLWILPYQVYKQKLNANQTTKMLELANRSPEANRAILIDEGLPATGIHGARLPPALNDSGMAIDPRLLQLPARRTPQPTVLYAQNVPADEKLGAWTNRGKKLFTTSRAPARRIKWLCPRGGLVYYNDEDTYVLAFSQFAKANGLRGLESERHCPQVGQVDDDWDVDELGSSLKSWRDKENVEMFILILPKNDSSNQVRYAKFKSAVDQIVGAKSLCLCEDKMVSFKRRGEALNIGNLGAYMSGVSLKVNVRFGNTNHTLKAELDLLRSGSESKTADTMIVGMDVVHPSPGSVDGTPSIAAVVASMDEHFGTYRGAMRYQPARTEIIDQMEGMMTHLLRQWKGANRGRLPGRILCYRDGVGDSQFADVRRQELQAIRNAWNAAQGGHAQGSLQLTFIIVTKRHHTRFFPVNAKDRNAMTDSGNCLPGTIVESGVTSPYDFDFFLQSHNGLNGTARPAHYHVLLNEMKISPKELQDLTNALCYTYARSTTAVSYATPAYYADHLCERGKQYLKPFFDGNQRLKDFGDDAKQRELDKMRNRGGENDGNPWNKALNDTMFWI